MRSRDPVPKVGATGLQSLLALYGSLCRCASPWHLPVPAAIGGAAPAPP